MSCLTFESLSAELDGELAELEREAVRSHLDGCDKCRARRTELLLLHAPCGKRGGSIPPKAARDRDPEVRVAGPLLS